MTSESENAVEVASASWSAASTDDVGDVRETRPSKANIFSYRTNIWIVCSGSTVSVILSVVVEVSIDSSMMTTSSVVVGVLSSACAKEGRKQRTSASANILQCFIFISPCDYVAWLNVVVRNADLRFFAVDIVN